MERYLGSQSPRRLLAAVGARMGVAGGVLSGIEVDAAPALAGPPPAVDRLALRVVTDSYFHQFESAGMFGDVKVERFAFPRDEPLGRNIMSEWGLALHAETTLGDTTRRVMIDFGYTSPTVLNNLSLMRIDPATLDALVLSHGHYDHFGGMVGFLAEHAPRLRKALPFYLGGEECFCARENGPEGNARDFGALDRGAIAAAGLRVLFAERPAVVADHGFTTGWIDQVSFENPARPTRMTVGRDANGRGCEASLLPESKRAARMLVDDFQHEHATCWVVKDKGLVVSTSCGHRGIVNTVLAARKVSGVDKVHAILGGFHLMPMSSDYARQTAEALAALEPDWLIPMHCSGETFIEHCHRALPGRVLRSSTGTRFTFGASAAPTTKERH